MCSTSVPPTPPWPSSRRRTQLGHTVIAPLLCPFPSSPAGTPVKSLLTLARPFPSTLAPRHSSACRPLATAALAQYALGPAGQRLTQPHSTCGSDHSLHRRKLRPRGLTCKVTKQEGGVDTRSHPTVSASTNTALWIMSALPSSSTAAATTCILYCYEACLVFSPVLPTHVITGGQSPSPRGCGTADASVQVLE